MSGADLPPNLNSSNPTPSADSPLESDSTSVNMSSAHPTIEGDESEGYQSEEWETVNLPNAMSIDQLPITDEDSTSEAIEESEVQQTTEHPSQLIQALHECNRDLINRVTELEAELDEYRQAIPAKESLLNQRTQELAFAQEQVSRLFGKLELSNQVIRRQQVLVETLTEQWEMSQARMAQMERECATAQQRYNEQFYELVEAQNTCRELRSRLHRQQRHTLQFKAALERCLEMQPRQINVDSARPKTSLDLPQINLDHADQDFAVSEPDSYPVAVSRSQPVQPWSSELTDDDSVERLDEIVRQEQYPDDFDPQLVDEWLELEEESPEEILHIHDHREEQQRISASERSELPNLEDIENNWNLDQSAQTPSVSNPFMETNSPKSPEIETSPRFIEDELDRIRIEYTSSTMPSFNIEIDKSGYVASAEPLELQLKSQQQAVSSTAETENWPAPLLQPTRQKKLRSLAAIELPRFPQSIPPEAVMVSSSEAEPF
ncbi:MAG: hypothetical protein AAFO04_12245 [Cyanobacteria bacterium J06592_8]